MVLQVRSGEDASSWLSFTTLLSGSNAEANLSKMTPEFVVFDGELLVVNWAVPPPSNSHYLDYIIYSRESL